MTPKIYAAVSAVMAEIDAIGKNSRNSQQNYNFRGIDSIYNEIHPLLIRHKIFTVPKVLESTRQEHTSKSGGTLFYAFMKIEYTLYADDGSSIVAIVAGEGMDSGDKASNKAMAGAHKYLFLQVFCIPTEDAKDSENDSHEVAAKPMGPRPVPAPQEEMPKFNAPAKQISAPGAYIFPFNNENKGKRLDEIEVYQLDSTLTWLNGIARPSQNQTEAMRAIEAFLEERERPAFKQK